MSPDPSARGCDHARLGAVRLAEDVEASAYVDDRLFWRTRGEGIP